ncbi:MAG: glutamate racemase [Candidatus Komeilibacteria bacterium]
MKVAVFDSGIGGKTFLQEARHALPDIEFEYFSDSDNVPYGDKDIKVVREYIFKAIDNIVKQDFDAIVIACNTATSIAINDLRGRYDLPIIGMEPAVKPAIKQSYGKKVLVLATPITVKEDKLSNLIKGLNSEEIVDLIALPKLVEFAENNIFNKEVEEYITDKIKDLNIDEYSCVVLGCTHFIYFKDIIQKLFPNTKIVDGNQGTINRLKQVLEIK